MKFWSTVFWLFVFPRVIFSQDERVFRKNILYFKEQKSEAQRPSLPSLHVESKPYLYDLDQNGLEESFKIMKTDGQDWFQIIDHNGRMLYELKLNSQGAESRLDKVKIIQLSQTHKCLILFFYEGKTQGKRFEATARIYTIAFRNQLTDFVATEGPHIFHEKRTQVDQYLSRDFRVEAIDLDKDETKEIIVHYNGIQRILRFNQQKWLRL